MKHVIIGAGAAGISAAGTIRKFKPDDAIVIISTDDAVYSRCMLHNYISGDRDKAGISFISEDFFAKNNIRWLDGKTVTGLDAECKLVMFADGSETFDKLLIASGSDSVTLPHLQGRNVLGLRHLCDAVQIRDRAQNAENIVIIGAGLVGLDAAYALVSMGKKPTVVDMAGSILALNLDSYAADVYKNKFAEAGCSFKLGQKVSGSESDDDGNIVSLTMDSGEKLPCDLVIVAVGSRPAAEFLANSGVACVKGVKVDRYMSTNIKDVYAAGDVTGLSGIWPNARKQGEVAAKNMCGVPVVYDDMYAIKNTINYFGIPSLSVGQVDPDEGDITEVRGSRSEYKKVIVREGIVVGVILQGNIAHSGFWQYLIKNKVNVSGVPGNVLDVSFADFYGVEENGEYIWAV